MVTLKQNYNLSTLNTFGISVQAQFFVEITDEKDLQQLFDLPEFKDNKKIFLGGGSNILFTKDFDGIVILNKLKGIEIITEDSEGAIVRAMSGEVWHDVVNFTVGHGYWGIENLALIPGTVGGAPMQNIGAYGVELKNTVVNVEAYDTETGKKRIFTGSECEFGYRDSIFKNKVKGKYFISAITLRLSKIEKKNTEYKILKNYLDENNIEVKNSKDIADAVATIRRSKLPDPKVIGNAGSFFKNVFVDEEKFKKFKEQYPDVPSFVEDGVVKIPAGWLVEQCGFKGKRFGKVGVHDKQALVIVNHGGATGAEVLDLANQIIVSVKEKFGLELVPEVNIV